MKNMMLWITIFVCFFTAGTVSAGPEDDAALRSRARELAQQLIITDGHVDVPYRLNKRMEDISRRTRWGDFDYERAKAGGSMPPSCRSTSRRGFRTAAPKPMPIS